MADIITQEDLTLVLSQSAAMQTMKLKIEVLDADRKIIGTLEIGRASCRERVSHQV